MCRISGFSPGGNFLWILENPQNIYFLFMSWVDGRYKVDLETESDLTLTTFAIPDYYSMQKAWKFPSRKNNPMYMYNAWICMAYHWANVIICVVLVIHHRMLVFARGLQPTAVILLIVLLGIKFGHAELIASPYADCKDNFSTLERALFETGDNRFQIISTFYPARERVLLYAKVFYYFCDKITATEQINCTEPQEWRWTTGSFYFVQAPSVLRFTSLFFVYPQGRIGELNITLPAECKNVSKTRKDIDRGREGKLEILTQRVSITKKPYNSHGQHILHWRYQVYAACAAVSVLCIVLTHYRRYYSSAKFNLRNTCATHMHTATAKTSHYMVPGSERESTL